MMYWNGHMTTAGWIIAVLWTVIIFVLIAGGIYWFVTALSGRTGGESPHAPSEDSPREILDRRVAKGELTVEQYKQLRETLDASAAAGQRPQPAHPAAAPR
jgi:putative membrane protein